MPDIVAHGGRGFYEVRQPYADLLTHIDLADAMSVFEHRDIVPWRRLNDRENCTIDAIWPDGRPTRLHVKRFPASNASSARQEAAGLALLARHGIESAALVAVGQVQDGRAFVITENLDGFSPCDVLIKEGTPFEQLLAPTASVAARLHDARLRHRDLYLCHFMGRIEGAVVEIRLIDTARVSPLPRLFARRWIVKDLAQFVFGAKASGVSDSQCGAWLEAYGNLRKIDRLPALKKSVHQKCAWIARHDKRLNQKQPHRNISIP